MGLLAPGDEVAWRSPGGMLVGGLADAAKSYNPDPFGPDADAGTWG